MKQILWIVFVLATELAIAQVPKEEWKSIYRETAPKINNLKHTRLNAAFNFEKSQLIGSAWLTLQPHFYPTDSLQLDAKGMEIKQVALVKNNSNLPLKYQYDGKQIRIQLNKSYSRNEAYTVFISYIAKPDELEAKGSAAITDAKGMYFINPTGADKDKPTQIWTQGETEATSVWVPTIDRPNQRCTQEFNLTVPAKFVSLSNGKLTRQQVHGNGTRTDQWVMSQPHAPYLFFIGVGDFAVVKDSYKGKEVSYYVEKEYEKVARKIFGLTPEMMQFFEKKLGIDYPWNKYSQIVGRDYVSGAMENTTATLHQESAQQDARQLTDGNEWESTIAHELFHQWFGDLVTAESWSNLTVNESFANYSELLWSEYKYGRDAAAYDNIKDMQAYLGSKSSAGKDLVRFYYESQEDMFDLVSYQKGGRILHMLRNYVGDEAFFTALHQYLTQYRFGNGSAHKLRLVFESVTGKDLNWFFNQWYFNHGHPRLEITYGYDAAAQLATVVMKQTQGANLFKLPVSIDVYEGASKKRYQVWMNNKVDSFYFPAATKPSLITADPERILLAEKKENKTLEAYAHQLKYGKHLGDRMEAVEAAAGKTGDPIALNILSDALNDPFFRIRIKALNSLEQAVINAADVQKAEQLAVKDPSRLVKAAAIDLLGKQRNPDYKTLFLQSIEDSSYSVAGAALEALSLIDSSTAYATALKLSKTPTKGKLNNAISMIIAAFGDETGYDYIAGNFKKMPLSTEKFTAMFTFSECLNKVTDAAKFKEGIDLIVAFRESIPKDSKPQTDPYINNLVLKALATAKEGKGLQELADYVKSRMVQ
ncbi:MAG: M1 family metallopeptidase [Sediminibacterium sp.]|nr:M1 family metallopeptidase [Sediminibacterium sp.]